MKYRAENKGISTVGAPLLSGEAGVRSFGDAVFSARVILGIDPVINTISYTAPIKQLSESLAENQVIVYPNPATHQVNLAFEKELNMIAVFDLYDFSGKLVLSNVLNAHTTFSTINLNEVKAGIYFYKLYTANETLAKNKLVILNK